MPINAAQCFTNPNGTTNIYYGGWASPYTDNYATDPLFTTSIDQGMADRRAPGTSWKVALTFTSTNKKWVFVATDAWYNYGNALAAQKTNDWNLDGRITSARSSQGTVSRLAAALSVHASHALEYVLRRGQATTCPAGASIGSTYLGGLPLFKYNRAQLEYDF